jgi:hypothetical protein
MLEARRLTICVFISSWVYITFMLIRTIGIFIVMGIITIIASRVSRISILDIVLLSAMLSPLTLLQLRTLLFRQIHAIAPY